MIVPVDDRLCSWLHYTISCKKTRNTEGALVAEFTRKLWNVVISSVQKLKRRECSKFMGAAFATSHGVVEYVLNAEEYWRVLLGHNWLYHPVLHGFLHGLDE